MWLRKRSLKRETESFQISAQNNTLRTNHIKTIIDKMQQNSRCRLCSDRDETINHVISECSKLSEKVYKIRHNWVGNVIHWELCKKLKFDQMNKWYMHNSEYFLENEMHKVLKDFEIQPDPLISVRRPDLIIINKQTKKNIWWIGNFGIPAEHTVELKESKKKDKYLSLTKDLEKMCNMKVTVIPFVIGVLCTVTKGLEKRLEDMEMRGRAETIPTTELLRSAIILRKVLETWGDLLSLKPFLNTIS